jgi:hypothetical protein
VFVTILGAPEALILQFFLAGPLRSRREWYVDNGTSLPNSHFGKDLLQCSHLFFRQFNQDPPRRRSSPIHLPHYGRTCNGSAMPGTTARPAGTATRFYAYLTAVYGLVAWWTAEGRDLDRARRALRLQRLALSDREDPFAAIIRCTADAAKADKRTRSKWSRAMRYAVAYKPDSEPLDQFIKHGWHQRLRCPVQPGDGAKGFVQNRRIERGPVGRWLSRAFEP